MRNARTTRHEGAIRGGRSNPKPKTEIYRSLGCEKIPAVQHGDDLAAREQFFEVIALAQFLMVEDAFPEGGSGDAKFGLAKEIDGDVHVLDL